MQRSSAGKLRKVFVPALVAGAVLAPAPALADDNAQCNTENGVEVREADDLDDTRDEDDDGDDGGSGNGGNNNDGDGIVNS
jgi:hypothetical protein